MKKDNEPSLYICTGCHRRLPDEAFYHSHKTGRRDYYCRECRKRMKAHIPPAPPAGTPTAHYPLIVNEPDFDRRMALILKARETVRIQVERHLKRRKEEEMKKELRMKNLF